MEKGVQLGLGEGLKRGVQYLNPVGTLGPALRMLTHTCAKRFL